MTNRVNPPTYINIPEQFKSDPIIGKFFDDLLFNMFQIWKRTGAGADFVDENAEAISDNKESIKDNRESLREFDDTSPFIIQNLPLKDDVVSTIVDYTTVRNQIIICNAALTVFLNDEPKNRETAKIKIANGDVIIDGNSKLVDNETDIKIVFGNIQGLAVIDVIYLVETDSWWII